MSLIDQEKPFIDADEVGATPSVTSVYEKNMQFYDAYVKDNPLYTGKTVVVAEGRIVAVGPGVYADSKDRLKFSIEANEVLQKLEDPTQRDARVWIATSPSQSKK